MNRKQDFLRKCENLLYDYIDPFEVPGALEVIKEALRFADPADLVRCGECKHLTNDRICPRWERICELTAGGKAENGYCDEGERRADDER